MYAVLCDVERWPQWTATMTRVTRTEPGAFGVGSGAQVVQPRLKAARCTVSELHPGRGFTWRSRAPGLRLAAGHAIEPQGAGCLVTLSFTISGWLGSLVARWVGPLVAAYLDTEADGLKAYCEMTRPR